MSLKAYDFRNCRYGYTINTCECITLFILRPLGISNYILHCLYLSYTITFIHQLKQYINELNETSLKEVQRNHIYSNVRAEFLVNVYDDHNFVDGSL